MSGILVSAVISLFKGEKFIRGRLEDLLAQTIAEQLEIIIIDSNSPQNEKAIIDEFIPRHPGIIYVRTDFTESMYAAWNRGIKFARGKYITNANADDRLAPDALEKLVAALEDDSAAGLVYSDLLVSPVENETYAEAVKNCREVKFLREFTGLRLLDGYMCGSESLWRREIHDKHNIMFDESFQVTGDYKFVCEVSKIYNLKKINGISGVYFRSEADENKEFQNRDITLNEAFRVKYDYAQFIIENNQDQKLTGLYAFIFNNAMSVPPKASAVLWKTLKPAEYGYETIYFLRAVKEEKQGKIENAIKIINGFSGLPKARIIMNYKKMLAEEGRI